MKGRLPQLGFAVVITGALLLNFSSGLPQLVGVVIFLGGLLRPVLEPVAERLRRLMDEYGGKEGNMKEELRVYYQTQCPLADGFNKALVEFIERHGWACSGGSRNGKAGKCEFSFDREEVTDPLEILLQ